MVSAALRLAPRSGMTRNRHIPAGSSWAMQTPATRTSRRLPRVRWPGPHASSCRHRLNNRVPDAELEMDVHTVVGRHAEFGRPLDAVRAERDASVTGDDE